MTQWIASLFIVLASLGNPFQQWGRSAESYFMTQEERAQWEAITTDDAAKRFIDAFHARHARDFSAEVRKRAQLVDERIALGETKASLTTRGKIIILLGAPAEVTVRTFPRHVPANVGHPLDTRKGGAADNQNHTPTVIDGVGGWIEYTLRYAPNPALGIGPDGMKVVIEAESNSGKDRLKYARRDAKKLEEVLDAAARTSLRR